MLEIPEDRSERNRLFMAIDNAFKAGDIEALLALARRFAPHAADFDSGDRHSRGGFRPMTTVQLQTSFLRPIPAGSADARLTARVLRMGKSLAFGETQVGPTTIFTADLGELVSRPPGSYARNNYDAAGNPTDACYWASGSARSR